jgi:Putative zinc-finger/FecR protein/HEAT repeats
MSCEDFVNLMNARVDGEIGADDAARLDAHLAECLQCRSASESVQSIDTDLRRSMVGRREAAARLAENVVATLRATSAPDPIAPAISTSSHWAWGQLFTGLAAGFLLAVSVFRPWEKHAAEMDLAPPIAPVARLAVASGPVEVWPANKLEAFTCPTGGSIERDSIIRTGPSARCELSLENGNALRLDCNTEVKINKSEVVEVNRGRLWSSSEPGRKGVEIQSGGGTIVARPAAQLAVDCQPPAARLIVLEGVANVQASGKSVEVGRDKQVRIVEGKVEEPDWCDTSLETAWVNSVLALRNSQHPELTERVNRLLANIGAAKLSLMYEDELRRLGDDGVPPLLAYLDATRGKPDVRERATAARIVADVAQPRWIPDMIALLTDANADVRFQAARGLTRVTGRDQGTKAETWQTEPCESCEGAYKKWLEWWAANRDRYPTARREVTGPKSPSK